MLKVLCKSYKRKRKTKNRNESEQKKEEPAQLGRIRGPKPGSSPAPAEPAQPRTLSLSHCQADPTCRRRRLQRLPSSSLELETAGRYSPLAPLTLRAIKPASNRLQVPRDPLSHPLFFPAQELAARPRIWSPESTDVDAVRH
jgi:hypothetical protein